MTTGLLKQWSTHAATRTTKSEIAQIAGLTPACSPRSEDRIPHTLRCRDQLSLSPRLCLGQRLDSFIDRLLVSG